MAKNLLKPAFLSEKLAVYLHKYHKVPYEDYQEWTESFKVNFSNQTVSFVVSSFILAYAFFTLAAAVKFLSGGLELRWWQLPFFSFGLTAFFYCMKKIRGELK